MKSSVLFRVLFLCFCLALVVWLYPRQSGRVDEGKVVNLSLPVHPDSLDPAYTDIGYSIQVLSKSYETLLEYHYLKSPAELVPNLVESMPEVSEDGRVYTFTLKKGVFFHDDPCFEGGHGRELVAEDVVYSFKRIADPSVRSCYFGLFKDLIVGFEELHQHFKSNKGDYTLSVDGLRAIDRYTVQFKLKEPFSLFLHYITMNCASVVAKEAVDFYGESFLNHPVGTGPFILKDFSPQSNKLTLVRNEKFREKRYPGDASPECNHLLKEAGKKLPLLSKIVYHILPEESSRWLQFKRKAIDVFNISGDCLPDVFTEEGQLQEELRKEGVELCQAPSYRMMYVGFNCSKFPFANKKLRQAMSLAFDRVEFNRLFLKGMGKLPNSYIPECFLGYDPDYENPYNYDLEKAKQYLAGAGYPDGGGLSAISLIAPLGSSFKSQAEFFAKCMEKIGIKVEVQQLLYPELIRLIKRGQYDLSMSFWAPDYPDAASSMFAIIRHEDFTGLFMNDTEFNEQYDASINLMDAEKKAAAYRALNVRAMELVPIILMPQLPTCALKQGHLKNFRIDLDRHDPELYWDIDYKK